jgi:hypothetical protein
MMFSVHESERNVAVLSLGALAALLAFAGCSRDPNHVQTGSADLTVRSLGARDISSVVATVSGPSLPAPKTFPLFARGSAAWGGKIDSLPVGSDYTFTVRAVDRSNTVDYAGSAAGIAIVKGQVSTVTIMAQQTASVATFKNAVPVIDTWVLSSVNIVPGAPITANVTAHDPNPGDTISFAWSASPVVGGFSAPSAATTTWTAPLVDGDQTLILTVTDNHGASTSASAVVHVFAGAGLGQADVSVRFNTWPVVTDLVAVPGYIVLGSPTSVSLTASDADGDALAYAWTSSCASGSFSSPANQAVSFTLPSGATDTSCDLIVAVSDGRGGSTTGQLTLPVGKPLIIMPPITTAKVQSVPVVDVSGSVNFAVEAYDPEGTALTFLWVSAVGVLSNQVDEAGSSQVVWTAPATANATFTVSVIVSNANGASVQSDFTVVSGPEFPADGGVCECAGTGPGAVPVTVPCGQSACGSDYLTYSCSASGWSAPGLSCGEPDGGVCECAGTGPGAVPVTVPCGQSACGSDYLTYSCSASGWSAPGQSCGGPDGGVCECAGTGPGGVSVTVPCGQSACGSDYLTYSCSASGWSAPGQSCGGPDGGVCECAGTGPGGVSVTVHCGQSACGSDYLTYSCSTFGWSSPGIPCL